MTEEQEKRFEKRMRDLKELSKEIKRRAKHAEYLASKSDSVTTILPFASNTWSAN